VPERRRNLPWKPVLIVFVSGIVLAASSCAGFISVMTGGHELRAKILTDGFFLGVAASLLSVFVLLVMAVLSMFTGKSKGPS
jgi:hypothetical protein